MHEGREVLAVWLFIAGSFIFFPALYLSEEGIRAQTVLPDTVGNLLLRYHRYIPLFGVVLWVAAYAVYNLRLV